MVTAYKNLSVELTTRETPINIGSNRCRLGHFWSYGITRGLNRNKFTKPTCS